MNNKVSNFTIKSRKQLKKNKIDHKKQIFMILGLLSLVITIPLILYSLLQPEGYFETRRQAAETESFYGYLRPTSSYLGDKIPDTFKSDDYYYFSLTSNINYSPINYGTEESPQYLIVSKNNIASQQGIEEIDETILYSLDNVTTTVINEPITLINLNSSSNLQAVSNNKPEITITSNIPDSIKVGQEFSIDIEINDDDNVYGDLLKKYQIVNYYSSGKTPSWNFIESHNQTVNNNFETPLFLNITGTPDENAEGNSLIIDIIAIDLIGNTTQKSLRIDIKKNVAPQITNIQYYDNEITSNNTYRLIYGTKNNINAKIKVFAEDSDDQNLSYEFQDFPTVFNNIEINNNIINFDIDWEDFTERQNEYTYKIIVSDGFQTTEQESTIYLNKGYSLYDGAQWSADFGYDLIENTYQVEFNRLENLYPSNDEIENFWWIFGDGIETYGSNEIVHTYPGAGTYEVTLAIIDSEGYGEFETKTVTISSIGDLQTPKASFIAIPQVGTAPLTVNVNPEYSSDADGTIVEYEWDFGDGETQVHNSPISFEHVYNHTGQYVIKLTVKDNDNLTNTSTSKITVGNNSSPKVTLTKPNKGAFGGTSGNPNNKITWTVEDNENDSPLLYNLYLIESNAGGVCNAESTMEEDQYLLSSGSINFTYTQYLPNTFNWNTATSKSGQIADGYYCVKIGVVNDTYGQLAVDYSDEPIEIINAQHTPYITTEILPEAIVGKDYNAQLEGYDEDSDNLTFELAKSPNWLKITDNGKLSGKPTEAGPQSIIAVVKDDRSKSGRVFTINVKETEGQVLPAITVNTNLEVFIENDGYINWEIENGQEIEYLNLQYSQDGINWINIEENISIETTEYNWNVTEIESGEYQIRLVYFNSEDKQLGASDVKKIEIANPEAENESEPLVYSFQPQSDEIIKETKPTISASFKPADDSEVLIETVRVYLDNKQIQDEENFEVFEGGFSYTPNEELSIDTHTIKAGFLDGTGKIANAEWSFVIESYNGIIEENKEENIYDKYDIYIKAIIVILILAIITLIAFFLVKTINTNRKQPRQKTPIVYKKKDNESQTITNNVNKQNITQQEALNQLQNKTIIKEPGEDNIQRGY